MKDLKKRIRLQPDKVQCRKTRKAPPSCLGCDRFVEAWKPSDLILTSRQKVRDQAQKFLFQRHKERFQGSEVPLLYHPNDSRKQNTLVTIPGTNQKEQLVLKEAQNNHCAACNIEILWAYQPKDTQQFSVGRLDTPVTILG